MSVNGTDLRNPFTTYFWYCSEESPTLLFVVLGLCLFLHSLKIPKKKNQEKWHRQWKSNGLYLKWTGTGLCHSTHV